jgi:hypothetical protein
MVHLSEKTTKNVSDTDGWAGWVQRLFPVGVVLMFLTWANSRIAPTRYLFKTV